MKASILTIVLALFFTEVAKVILLILN
jgi:hypothetical protein